MTRDRCESCRHFDDRTDRHGNGLCRANPPLILEKGDGNTGVWPIVHELEWCSHWRSRDAEGA